ncbi:LBF_2804 family protein [Candidatus Viridilinea mediisalina]|uniref:Uncharacterized protein n=1 Tax=Candidatus Viridilinea mediisalina TaxID=2024553 RepID=A0A2A6RJY3_9CHLR|nr:hypothetical protein [Candidatus Viridilinea mediisalina]PDW03180.1 hypothetical protein CJ255_10230 [Candidatus Viridilinea mediisalina]
MEKLYRYIFDRFPLEVRKQTSGLHTLDRQEQDELHSLRRVVMIVGFSISIISNSLLFLVYYIFPQLFPVVSVTLPFFEQPISLEPVFWAWIGIIVVIELLLLIILNLYSVHRVAVVTGFIHANSRATRRDAVMEVALQTPARELANYGIDPYQGVNRLGLWIFNSMLKLKGTITHRIVRMLLLRILGRSALRLVLDFSGVPVYGTINALAARRIQREAQVLIMGRAILNQIKPRLPAGPLDRAGEDLLYDTLQYIAISKRDYHHNHLLLTQMFLEHYGIAARERHLLEPGFEQRLQAAPHELRQLTTLIILLGFIFDGYISWRERIKLAALQGAALVEEEAAELQRYTRDFLAGQGLDDLIARYLPSDPSG